MCSGSADSLFSPMQEAEQRQSLPWRASKRCLMSPFNPAPNVPELTVIFQLFVSWNLCCVQALLSKKVSWEGHHSLLASCGLF